MLKSVLRSLILPVVRKSWKYFVKKNKQTNDHKRLYKWNVSRFHSDVCEILQRHDIFGLCKNGAPKDEYDLEAMMILGDLRIASGFNEDDDDAYLEAIEIIAMRLVEIVEATFDLEFENEKLYNKYYDEMVPVADDLICMMQQNNYLEATK